MSLNAAGVWASAAQSLSWASRTSSVLNSPPNQSSQWGNGGEQVGETITSSVWAANTAPTASIDTNIPINNSVWNNEHSSVWMQPITNSLSGNSYFLLFFCTHYIIK